MGQGDVHPVESGNQLTASWLDDGHFTGCPVDQTIYDGDKLQFGNLTLYAIATPGHTPGSFGDSLPKNSKHVLCSGDIASHAGRHAWMGHPYADWDLYLKSLEKLANYSVDGQPIEFDILLPGHGTVDMEKAMRSIRETMKIVRYIIARRKTGEDVDWVKPYRWNWNRGIVYSKKSPQG